VLVVVRVLIHSQPPAIHASVAVLLSPLSLTQLRHAHTLTPQQSCLCCLQCLVWHAQCVIVADHTDARECSVIHAGAAEVLQLPPLSLTRQLRHLQASRLPQSRLWRPHSGAYTRRTFRRDVSTFLRDTLEGLSVFQ